MDNNDEHRGSDSFFSSSFHRIINLNSSTLSFFQSLSQQHQNTPRVLGEHFSFLPKLSGNVIALALFLNKILLFHDVYI